MKNQQWMHYLGNDVDLEQYDRELAAERADCEQKLTAERSPKIEALRKLGCSEQAIAKLFEAAENDSLEYMQFSSHAKKAAVLAVFK